MWKMMKISTNTCVHVTKKHPYVTSCVFFLFLIYMCCPLFFWIFIYSLPPAVSTWVVLHIRDGRRCKEEGEKESEQKERESGGKMVKKTMFVEEGKVGMGKGKERIKKAYSRVHSMRRRKAKEIERGDDPYAAAKRNAGDVDTDEEDEDEDDEECNPTDPDRNVVEKRALIKESPKEIHEVQVDFLRASASTGTDTCMDVSISNTIYRNPEVVRSLRLLKDEEDAREEAGKAMDVNIAEAERNKRLESLIARRRSKKVVSQHVKRSLMNNDATMMPLIAITKVSTWCSPSRSIAPFSPGPGSAPSMLGLTRNPFDLPYDPQEEKPDLTEDNFQQEFASGHNRDFIFCRHESFSLGPFLPKDFFEDRDDDFEFRRRRSSVGYQYPRPETEESESGHESDSGPDSKSNLESLDSDQIKEVDNRANALDKLSLSEGSTGSSNEDRPPLCKINREAILKSLSMRRNSVSIPDINDHLQLQDVNSALENASRLKRHGMTFSIASDIQVEASELSSPPRNASWDGLDSWAGSSRLSEVEDIRATSSASAATENVVDSNDHPPERLHHPTISPKSVLQPTLSVVSFEHEEHGEVQLSRPRPADHSSSNGAAESSQQKIQVLDGSASHESGSSTSLSSDVDSSDMDFMNEESMIQESNAFEAANASTWIDKGNMVIQESSHEHDTETSSEDYDSEVEERDDLHQGGV